MTLSPQSYFDWINQYQCASESPGLEVAGCEWHYTLIVVQARNDDDDKVVTSEA